MKQPVITRIEEVARRVAESEGLELVEVELLGGGHNRLVRISIDKPNGVSHADCELVSQQVGTILDVEDVVPGGSYTLEVSSPGVERKLLRPQDYERFQGQKVKVILKEPIDNQSYWEGILAGMHDGLIRLDAEKGKTIQFRFDQIKKANLKFEW
ncbi:MAG: ribosome maturation factor RimP [Acidobacteria bacterium]|nr:ribosome maturation factor RimP [Acidobacteriota bacterium]